MQNVQADISVVRVAVSVVNYSSATIQGLDTLRERVCNLSASSLTPKGDLILKLNVLLKKRCFLSFRVVLSPGWRIKLSMKTTAIDI